MAQADRHHITRRSVCAGIAGSLTLLPILAQGQHTTDVIPQLTNTQRWRNVLQAATKQEVYWNAWGGNPLFNGFIQEAIQSAKQRHSIEVNHVRIASTSEAVSRIIAESEAGNTNAGTIDLIWINGENFAKLRDLGLLYGPIIDEIPNAQLIDPKLDDLTRFDTTVPTDGLEVPWGRAHFNFYADFSQFSEKPPPHNAKDFLEYARKHPQRLTYPAPPDFVGTTFLKQLLLDLLDHTELFYRPLQNNAQLNALWDYLDQWHPSLLSAGRGFVDTATAMIDMVNNRQIDVGMSFNLATAQLWKNRGRLPRGTQTYFFSKGSIGNVNFLAIPFNARAKEAALVMINHLLSPTMQLRRADPFVWGDLSVLKPDVFDSKDRQYLDQMSTLPESVIADFHPSWDTAIKTGWQNRYRL